MNKEEIEESAPDDPAPATLKPALMNITDAAHYAGVTVHWLRVKSSQKEFPPGIRFRAGLYLVFDPDALVAWIKSGGAARPTNGGRPPKRKDNNGQ